MTLHRMELMAVKYIHSDKQVCAHARVCTQACRQKLYYIHICRGKVKGGLGNRTLTAIEHKWHVSTMYCMCLCSHCRCLQPTMLLLLPLYQSAKTNKPKKMQSVNELTDLELSDVNRTQTLSNIICFFNRQPLKTYNLLLIN